jgi:pilus assembly protein Flp/PilA
VKKEMNRMKRFLLHAAVWKDTRGQDLVEYALLAGFVAVAAGALLPGISTSISTIFSRMGSVLTAVSS